MRLEEEPVAVAFGRGPYMDGGKFSAAASTIFKKLPQSAFQQSYKA